MNIKRSLLLSFIQKYTVLVVSTISVLILARILTPIETGIFTIASGIINIAQDMRDFGVMNYILQEKDLTKDRLGTAFTITFLFGLVFAGLFVGCAPVIADYFNSVELQSTVYVLALNFLLVPFGAVAWGLLRRKMDFDLLMRIGIAQAIVNALVSIGLAREGYGALSLAWASVAGNLVNVIGAALFLREGLLIRPSLREWRKIIAFGGFSSAAMVLSELSQRLPEILVGRVQGLGAAGFFSRGNSFVTLFNQAVTDAVWPVASSGLALYHRGDQPMATPYLHMISFLTGLAWPVLLALAILAHPIMFVVFGAQWSAAVPVAQGLSIATAFFLLGRINITLLNSCGRPNLAFHAQILMLPVLIAALALTVTKGIGWVAASMIAVFACFALHTSILAIRTARARWTDVLVTLLRSLGVTAISMIPLAAMTALGCELDQDAIHWPTFLTAGVGTALAWVVALIVLDHPLKREAASQIQAWRSRKNG